MKKSIFAVCDLEESYACKLTEYMNERRNAPFEVQAFTNLESLAAFAETNHIELLLISTEAMCDAVRQLDVERIIILSDGEEMDLSEQEPCVYKYQSTDGLLAEVMNYYAQSAPALMPMHNPGRAAELLGVYSPINRVGKTTFALTLGELLSERKKVLYLNLEYFSGFETLFSKTYRSDIADLIYFARQKEGNLIYKLNGMIHTLHGLDYIPPAFSPGDLREVSCQEWMNLIGEIAAGGEYEVIILDVSHQVEDWFELLRQCRKIYMPVLEDSISQAKILQCEKVMDALDYSEVKEKIRQLHLPKWAENVPIWTGRLSETEMGAYVRQMMEQEKKEKSSETQTGYFRIVGRMTQ